MFIVAYWGDGDGVAWVHGDDPDCGWDTLYGAMERYLLKGEVTEILDVVYADPYGPDSAGARKRLWEQHIEERGKQRLRTTSRKGTNND